MANYGSDFKFDPNNMSYDETCIMLFGKDSEELEKEHESSLSKNN